MPRFAANVTFLFSELPFLSRFEAAARAGFGGVEFHYPYAHDPYAVKSALDASGLAPVLINIRAGDHAAGEWGFAGVPGRESTFRICVEEAISYAAILGVPQVNCLVGVRGPRADAMECTRVLTANLTFAAKACAEAGLQLNLEPLNTIDVPGYLVARSDFAHHLIERIGQPNLRLQFDWYHAAMMGEDIGAQLKDLLPAIGHMQFADAPGRHEPGSGDTDFPRLFALVDELGYKGWLSAEYKPSGETGKSLGWIKGVG
ncbi:MAG: TIM barrel protein [Betaproteobacteria bacterium]|nr:TIM barrel protein [Betaproteobacteria bacterium]